MQATQFVSPSDARLKDDVRLAEIDDRGAYEELWNLRPVTFRWKSDNRIDIGLIAQDVQEAVEDYPELASLVRPISDNSNVYLGIDYSKLSLVALMMAKKNYDDIAHLPRDGVAGLAELTGRVDLNTETVDGISDLLGDLPALAVSPGGRTVVAVLKALYEQVRLITIKIRDPAAAAPPAMPIWPDTPAGVATG
jgi:hypothetical protein